MKKYKTLLIYYLITIVLSLISIFSFHNKSNDFFAALSSLSADFTLIISVIMVTYVVLFCCSYIKDLLLKKEKKYDKKMLFTLLILLITVIVVFISFINVFSHKNIIEFIIDVVKNNENKDIIRLFIDSLFAYYFIYLCAVNGLIINNMYLSDNNEYVFPLGLIIFTIIISFILSKVGIRLLYLVFIINIVLYYTARLLWGKYEKRNKNKK